MSNFFRPFHSLHLFQQFQADCVYKKSLEDACYLLLQSVSLVFYLFSLIQLFQWKMSNFLSPFHLLHLFQQFQADCVYKKSFEDACYFLLQSVSLVFYSFSLFQLFQWKISIFLEGRCWLLIVTVCFIGFLLINIVSVVSVEDVQFFPLLSLSRISNSSV